MRTSVRAVSVLCCAVAGLLVAGCQRIADVSGTVRVDGKPIKGLIVVFDPQSKDAPRGVATTADEGRYQVRRLGPGAKTGVPVGTYAVRVSADPDSPGAPKIPADVSRGSVFSFEVKPGSENVFDIEISTK
ncbi:MAG: hypothetical protein ACKO40_08725 [Planctomycetaceae bacterium]